MNHTVNELNTSFKKGGRIIIAGGGTGGHIFPAIAIANALRRKDPTISILFVGAKGKMEMEKVPQAGYEIIGLDIAGFNRSSLLKNLALPFKILKSMGQASKVMNDFNPDVVVGVGGYASFPMLRIAQKIGIPTLIQEQNSYAGKTNKLLGKKAARICVAYDGMDKVFPEYKIKKTGNPVRDTIENITISQPEGLRHFSLEEDKKTLLVVGGSLGAKSVNEAIEKHIDKLLKNNIQLIWQTGKNFVHRAAEQAVDHRSVWVNDFISQMEYAYAAADLVVSRAGALAIAELCIVKKPVLFVPYPHAAEDHQTVNALSLVNQNAALMVPDGEALDKVVPMIIELAKDEERQLELKENIGKMAMLKADETIADEVFSLIKSKKK
ncbi:MAG: undecaprenyldiphospho-muramoylpentapeptide beta-N-acetylglucosaminyltransferase [Chitinophagaceae bacterium]|nr:undecaprenyldiphospho-muramoylpentapeptide beta-N-acetylglucosaminyltransferase [Chitinophagaceae bacterium]